MVYCQKLLLEVGRYIFYATQIKIAVLSYKVLHDSAPRYLGPLIAVADLLYLVGVLRGQQVPAAWSYRPPNYLLLAAVPFRLLQLKFGTVCQRPSSHRHHCSLSGIN